MKKTRNRIKSGQNSLLFTTTSKTHQKKKLQKIGIWTGICLVTLVIVGVSTHFAVESLMRKLVFENPRYALKEIKVEIKGNISRKQVIAASHLVLGQNVMLLNLKRIQKDVDHLPYVGDSQVIRQLPDKMLIRVTERIPVARINAIRTDLNMRELMYLDRDGIIIKPQLDEVLKPVPEITGGRFTDLDPGQRIDQPEVLATLNLLKLMEISPIKSMVDVHHFDVSHPLTLTLVAQDGLLVHFRADHLEAQIERLMEILDYANRKTRQLATVDLTPELNVPATFKN